MKSYGSFKTLLKVSSFMLFMLVVLGITCFFSGGNVGVAYAASQHIIYQSATNSWGGPIYSYGYDADGVAAFNVPFMYRAFVPSGKPPLFSIEHNANSASQWGDDAYDWNKSVDDLGLKYILANSYANNKYVVPEKNNEWLERWITQVAIWVYLRDANDQNSRTYLSDEDFEKIQSVTKLGYIDCTGVTGMCDRDDEAFITFDAPIYETYVADLVANAKELAQTSNNVGAINTSITAKIAGNSFSIANSDGYYQSELVTVNTSNDIENYSISLNGIDGLRAVDADGKVLDLSNVVAGTNFYIQVPVDKVTTKVQIVNISVNASTNNLSVEEYAKNSYQKLVLVEPNGSNVSDTFNLEIVSAPDTSRNIKNIIVFLGLLMLVAGCTIIFYVKNSKLKGNA